MIFGNLLHPLTPPEKNFYDPPPNRIFYDPPLTRKSLLTYGDRMSNKHDMPLCSSLHWSAWQDSTNTMNCKPSCVLIHLYLLMAVSNESEIDRDHFNNFPSCGKYQLRKYTLYITKIHCYSKSCRLNKILTLTELKEWRMLHMSGGLTHGQL